MPADITPGNSASRECPMCGGTMRFRESQTIVQIPGNPKPTTRTLREWICPDCDYFEELEEGA